MKLVLNKKDFINAMKIAIITTAKEGSRYLHGVFIEAHAGNVVNIVSSDGTAITRVTLDAPVADSHSYIIKRDDVERLIKSTTVARDGNPNEVTDMIELEYSKGELQGQILKPGTVVVRDSVNVTTCELLDTVFPDYRRVISVSEGDNNAVRTIGVEPKHIGNVVKALKVITNKTAVMNIEFNGAEGLIKIRPSSFHSAAQMTDVLIGVMSIRIKPCS